MTAKTEENQPDESAGDAEPGPHWRYWVGLISAPLALVVVPWLPLGLEPEAHRLAAVFLAVVIAWITEVVPVAVTALLIAPLLVAFRVCDAQSAFRWYADPLLFLFVGGFFIAKAMHRHGLDRRMASALMSLPFARSSPKASLAALLLAACAMSMWVSNTATCAMLVPILLGLPGMGAPKAGERDPATAGLLALAYVCSAGGIGTLVGTPPNLIAVRLLGEAGTTIGFVQWLAIGLPVALLIALACFLMTVRAPKAKGAAASAPIATAAPSPRGPLSRGEWITALSFGLAVIGWVVPDVLEMLEVPGAGEIAARTNPGAVAVLASLPLFLVPDARKAGAPAAATEAVLPWREGVRIDWGVIMLFGGGISLGKQLVDTGLADVLGRGVVESTGVSDLWALTALTCVFTIFFTEVCSNTASTNMLVPIVIGIATRAGVSPVPPALAVALAASCAFMLPIATGPNAIVYGTERVPQASMMRAGFGLNLISAAIVFGVLRVICPLMGWS